MGTRASIRIFDGEQEICAIYHHCDGYPTGLGKDLVAFCAERRIVNGLGQRDNFIPANGADCLAASIVAFLKSEPGGVYLRSPGPISGMSYEYRVRCTAPIGRESTPIVVECFEMYGTPRQVPADRDEPEPEDAAEKRAKATKRARLADLVREESALRAELGEDEES